MEDVRQNVIIVFEESMFVWKSKDELKIFVGEEGEGETLNEVGKEWTNDGDKEGNEWGFCGNEGAESFVDSMVETSNK